MGINIFHVFYFIDVINLVLAEGAPSLVSESPSSWLLGPSDMTPVFFSCGMMRCSILIWYISCSRHGINHFSGDPSFPSF